MTKFSAFFWMALAWCCMCGFMCLFISYVWADNPWWFPHLLIGWWYAHLYTLWRDQWRSIDPTVIYRINIRFTEAV